MNAPAQAPTPSSEAADLAEVYKHAKPNCHLCRGAGYYRILRPHREVVERHFILREAGKLITRAANVMRRQPRQAGVYEVEKETCVCAERRAEKALKKAAAEAKKTAGA